MGPPGVTHVYASWPLFLATLITAATNPGIPELNEVHMCNLHRRQARSKNEFTTFTPNLQFHSLTLDYGNLLDPSNANQSLFFAESRVTLVTLPPHLVPAFVLQLRNWRLWLQLERCLKAQEGVVSSSCARRFPNNFVRSEHDQVRLHAAASLQMK